jgi:hypothetical protein
MTSKLYLTKRAHGYYYIGWYEGNHRRWKSTKCTTKSAALTFLKSFESESLVKVEPLRLSKFTELFRSRTNGTIRKSTLRPYLSSYFARSSRTDSSPSTPSTMSRTPNKPAS